MDEVANFSEACSFSPRRGWYTVAPLYTIRILLEGNVRWYCLMLCIKVGLVSTCPA